MRYFVVFCLVISVALSVNGARILGIFHVPTKSHHIVGDALMRGLAANGHEVTVASPYPPKDKVYKHIDLEGIIEIGDKVRKNFISTSHVELFLHLSNFTNKLADTTIRSPQMQELIKSKTKFDILIIEPFGNEAFFALAHLFDSQVVVFSPANSYTVNSLSGNVAPYSFVPHITTTYSDKMTFIQRWINTFANILYDVFFELVVRSTQKQLYEDISKDAPPFEEAYMNASLFLINSHVIFESPRPYLPNMIPVGGLHISEPKKLPKDLQEFMDNAKDGVILFSLGSNLYSNDLPTEKKEIILNTFAKLPQKVLWKFEDNLTNLPKNVKISKWLPQSDILAHPNLKLFITHGGLLSTTEIIYRGVPILGMPFYGDQHNNVHNLVAGGFGEKILLDELTEELFTEKLKQLLETSSYRENVKRASEILYNQETKPIDRAVFWIEHVIKYGAKHLKSASRELSLAQYLLLDVFGFTFFVLGTFIVGIYLSLKTLCCSLKLNENKRSKSNKSKRV